MYIYDLNQKKRDPKEIISTENIMYSNFIWSKGDNNLMKIIIDCPNIFFP